MDINNVSLQGRLTKDADMKYTKNNLPLLNFAIACNRLKRQGEENSAADFINCRIYGEKCEKIQGFLTKGRQVFLTGRLQIDNYEEHGQFKSYTQVIVNQISFVWTDADKSKKEEKNEYRGQHGRPQEAGEYFEDDIPF